MKKIIIKLLLLSGFILTASTTFAATAEEAVQVAKKSVNVVLDDLRANKKKYLKNPAAINNMIEDKMLAYFDLDAMVRLVLARHWKKSTPKQRQEFSDSFKQLILRTYSSGLLDYTSSKVKFGKPNKIRNNRTKVDFSVIDNIGKRYFLTLSMGYRNGEWKCYDISLDGLSLITSYRNSIGEEIEQKGLQSVIDEIRNKNINGAVEK